MVNVALFVRLEAKSGKEADVAKFLRDGLAIVQEEPATTACITRSNLRLIGSCMRCIRKRFT